MKFFEKRPFSLILCIMLGGFSLFALADINIKLTLIGISAFLLGLSFIRGIFILSKIKLFRICSICFIISIFVSILWQNSFMPNDLDSTTANIEAEIVEVTPKDNYTIAIAKTNKINNEEYNIKVKLYLYSADIQATEGDLVTFTADIKSLLSVSNAGDNSYLYADGISALANDVENFTVIGHENDKLNTLLKSIRANITGKLIDYTNEETGGFISSLLIGDRTNLDSNTNMLFRRIGISHILALSGMHLVIITHALSMILMFLKVRKKIRISIITVFTFLYMALVGFTPSITRAGIMLIVYHLLFLMARTRDSFTSLTISVFLIVLFNPCSVFDISLWLSAFATLGIICLSELSVKKQDEKVGIVKRCLMWLINSLLASIFAIGCTLIFTISSFDTISVMSVISTLIFSPLIELFIYSGMLLLIFGSIIPLGGIIISFSDLIKLLADFLGRANWTLCSTDFVIVKILAALFTASFFSFFVFNVKKKKVALTLIFSLFVAIYITGVTQTSIIRNTDSILYSSAESKNNIMLKSDGEVAIIASDDMTSSLPYSLLTLTNEERITHIDRLILCGYTDELPRDLSILLGNLMIEYIQIPEPMSDAELSIAEELSSLLSKYSATLRFFKAEEAVSVGEYSFTLLYRSLMIRDASTESVYELNDGENDYFYFSKSAHISAPLAVRNAALGAHTIIIGYGSGTDKFDLYLNPTHRIIARDENSLDKDLIEYIKQDEELEIIYTRKIILK